MGFGGLGLRQVGSKNLKDNAIVNRVIATDAVTSAKIAPDTILGIDINDDAIGSREIASDAVAYADQIKDDLIGSQHLGNNALSYAAQIKDNIIGYSELTAGLLGTIATGSIPPANSIGTTHLKVDSVGSRHLRNNALSYAGQIKDDVIGSQHIADNAITRPRIIADAIDGTKIEDNAVGSEHLGNDAISYAGQIKDDVIGSQHIADNAVTRPRIIADAIDGTKIEDNAVGSEHITDSAVTRARIAADAIDGTKIEDNAVGSEHLGNDAISYAGQIKDDIIGSQHIVNDAIGTEHLDPSISLLSQSDILSDATPFAGADIGSIKTQIDNLTYVRRPALNIMFTQTDIGYNARNGDWAVTDAATYYTGAILSNTTKTQNDEAGIGAFYVPSSGVYTAYLLVQRATDAGKLHILINDSDVANLDLYNVSTDYNIFMETSLGTLTAGLKVVAIKASDKNASSSAYNIPTQAFIIMRE